MTRDRLGKLLAEADLAAGVPGGASGDLARRVRIEAARRRRIRVRAGVGTAAAVAILILVITIPTRLPGTPSEKTVAMDRPEGTAITSDPQEVARLMGQVAALRAEAAGREVAVAAMVRRETAVRGAWAGRVAAVDPLERIRAAQDVGAMAMVRQADRRYRESDRKDPAVAAYGRVVELFPKSVWASVARQRLVEIGG
jgi:hypothetical protein